MKIIDVTNPVYSNIECSTIDCFITIELDDGSQVGPLPFTSSPIDVEEHSREIYVRATEEAYGPIGAYVPPAPPEEPPKVTLAELQAQIAFIQGQISSMTNA